MRTCLASFILVIFYFSAFQGEVQARDTRLALLVANQQGWRDDPKLSYAVKGDLQPMAKAMQRLGFKVYKILKNKNADTLRQTLRKLLKRLNRKPRVTTFFFYYSGHADKTHFHMGLKGKNPMSYKEFVSFLDKMKVHRRFGIIDACFSGEIIRQFGALSKYRNLLSKGLLKRKGVMMHRLSRHDLSKHFPQQGLRVRGLQVLSSSQQLSYESKGLKGSVFTHFVLKGLHGGADLNQDGKISFNELFMYAKPRVRKATGQNPQQWLFRAGGESYSFAPVYQSELRIPAELSGYLQVSVGNFFWGHYKNKGLPLRLAMAKGKGTVGLRQGSKCLQQSVQFPKGGSVTLRPKGWRATHCKNLTLLQKKGIGLPFYDADDLPPQPSFYQVEFQAGGWSTSGVLGPRGDLSLGGLIGAYTPYFLLQLGVWGTSQGYTDGSYLHMLFELRLGAGYRRQWRFVDLFVGGFVAGGLLMQDLSHNAHYAAILQLGAMTNIALLFSRRWAPVLQLSIGGFPIYIQDQFKFHLTGTLTFGLRFYL